MTSFNTDDLKLPSIEMKELKLSIPETETNDSNILFLSDCGMPTNLKLKDFETMREYKLELFQNRSLSDVFLMCKFLWFNVRDPAVRSYISKNLKGCPYHISVVYSSGGKDERWIKEIREFVGGNCSIISMKRLLKHDGLNTDDLLTDLMASLVKITAPTSKAVKLLNMLCCSGQKKSR